MSTNITNFMSKLGLDNNYERAILLKILPYDYCTVKAYFCAFRSQLQYFSVTVHLTNVFDNFDHHN